MNKVCANAHPDDDARYVLHTLKLHSASGHSSGRCGTSAMPYMVIITSYNSVIG